MFDTGHVLTIYLVWFVAAYALAYFLLKKNS